MDEQGGQSTTSKGYENLLSWQKARMVHKKVRELTSTGPIVRDFEMVRQMRGAALSVPSNIAEGYERGSRAEFHKGLVIAKGSCGELKSQVLSAYDSAYFSREAAFSLVKDVEEVCRLIEGLRRKVFQQRGNVLDRNRGYAPDEVFG